GLTIAADAAHDFEILELKSPAGRNWIATSGPGTVVTINGSLLDFGRRAAGFRYESATTSNDGHIVRLDVSFVLESAGLRVTRHVAAASGSPTFDTWTSFEPLASAVSASDLNAFQLRVPVGTVRWLNGLQGDAADITHDTAFTLRQQDVAVGSPLVLGAQGRSSEQTVPWIAIDGTGDEFYAGLMWSGAWTLTVERAGAGLNLSWQLAAMTTTVRGAIDGPHAIVGVASGGLPQASAA